MFSQAQPHAELEIETTCIDINKEMILAMNSLLKIKNPNESIVIENWLQNSLEDNSFDVVIGDCVLENVKWEERGKLLSEVKRVLKTNGIFMMRFFSVPRVKPFKTLEELLRDYEKREASYRTALEFIFDMQIFCYNSEDHKGTFTKPKKELEKIRGKNGFHFPEQKSK